MTDEEVLEYARQIICNYIVLEQGVPKDVTFNSNDLYVVSYTNALGIWRIILVSSLEDNYVYVVEVDVDDCTNDRFCMFENIKPPNNKNRIFCEIPDDEETRKLTKKTNKALYTEVDFNTRIVHKSEIRDRGELPDGVAPSETFNLVIVQKN